MGRLESIYEEIPSLIESEIKKNLYKRKKGSNILSAPAMNQTKKHVYEGIAQKEGDTIVKVYPDIEQLDVKMKEKVRKVLTKGLNQRKIGNYEWFKICEL